MKGFATAVGIFVAGGIVFYVIRFFLDYLIIGTTFGDNIMTYFIPTAVFIGTIIAMFWAMFRKRTRQM